MLNNNAYDLKRKIECEVIETGVKYVFPSKNQASRYSTEILGVKASPSLVYLICEGKNRVKTAGKKLKFKYAEDDAIITNEFPHGRQGKIYKKRTDKNEKVSIAEQKEEI
jgi:hypothetical protein